MDKSSAYTCRSNESSSKELSNLGVIYYKDKLYHDLNSRGQTMDEYKIIYGNS